MRAATIRPVNEPTGIYRGEVLAIMEALIDIRAHVERIHAIL